MNCLLVYYSLTGQAARAVEVAAQAARDAGWTPTIVAISFADPTQAPRRPFTLATSKLWTQAAQRGTTFPMRYEPADAMTRRYDFVLLFSNTWGGQPSVPVRSFLESEQAKALLQNTPVGVVVVCRRLWQDNVVTVQRLVEAAGGRFVEAAPLIHFGGQVGSLIQTVTYMMREDSGRRSFLGFPLPRFGLSDESMASIGGIVRRLLGKATQS